MVFITETECVYCAVRDRSLNKIYSNKVFENITSALEFISFFLLKPAMVSILTTYLNNRNSPILPYGTLLMNFAHNLTVISPHKA